MAYAQGQVIKADDLGKILTNGDVEIANYKVFSITVSANIGVTKYFTVIFARDSGGKYYTAMAPNVATWTKQCVVCKCRFDITLSDTDNIFSLTNCHYTDYNGHDNVTFGFAQIRGLM